MTAQVTMPPLVDGMSDDDYHADPVPGGSISSTGMKRLLRSPAAYRYAVDHPQAHSDAFDLGKVAHAKVLGTGADLVVVDADSWRTNAAKQQRDDARAAGKVPLLAADAERVDAMVDAVLAHPIAAALLAAEGQSEQSAFWQDEATGVWCRARFDRRTRLANGRPVVVDLKTAVTAAPGDWGRHCHSFGYHVQASHYLEAARHAAGDEDPAFLFIAVEKEAPHLVAVHELDAAALARGAELAHRARALYAHCTSTGDWPGYPPEVALVSLPPYAFRDREDFL